MYLYKTQIKHLDSSLKYSRDKKESLSLTKFLREEELAYYSHEFEEHNIVPQIDVVNDFNITVNSGKLIQVLIILSIILFIGLSISK